MSKFKQKFNLFQSIILELEAVKHVLLNLVKFKEKNKVFPKFDTKRFYNLAERLVTHGLHFCWAVKTFEKLIFTIFFVSNRQTAFDILSHLREKISSIKSAMAKTFGSILNAFSDEPKKESVAHMTQVREGLIIIETQSQIQIPDRKRQF